MKRTKWVNTSRFRKRRLFASVSLVLAAGGGLYAFNRPVAEAPVAWQSVQSCVESLSGQADTCTAAWYNAHQTWQQSAPRYAAQTDCEATYGNGNCEQHHSTTTIGGYSPKMQGFGLRENTGVPLYGAPQNTDKTTLVDASGQYYRPPKPLLATQQTQSRGGFGRTTYRLFAHFGSHGG